MARSELLYTYALILLTGGFALFKYYQDRGLKADFPLGTYSFIALHGLLGTIIYAQNSNDTSLGRWLYNTRVFIRTISLPCLVTTIWLMFGVIQKEAAWAHTILGAIPALIYVYDDRLERKWIDAVVYICCCSLAIVCFQNDNTYGMLSGICFAIGCYIHRNIKFIMNRDPTTWCNLFTSAFTVLSFIAINETGSPPAVE